MSSVSTLLNGLSSSKMSSIKLIASVSEFCSIAALLTLSNSCFSFENSLFVVCVPVSIVLASLTSGSTTQSTNKIRNCIQIKIISTT